MANSNFVVQNGLTVGPLTIDATTGDIATSGNLTVSGSGQINVTNIGVSSISKNDTSISISDTGSGSNVRIIVDGITEHTIDANGVNLDSGDYYAINGTSVLSATTLGSGVTTSSLTAVGTVTSGTWSSSFGAVSGANLTNLTASNLVGTAATANVALYDSVTATTTNATYYPQIVDKTSGNVAGFTSSSLTYNPSTGVLAATIINGAHNGSIGATTPNTGTFTTVNTGGLQAVAIGNTAPGTGAFTTLSASGITNITNATGSTSTSTGALVVGGGIGVAGNVWIGGNLYVANVISTTQSTIVVQDSLVYFQSPTPGQGQFNYDIGFFSDYTAPYYAHTGVVRSFSSNTWNFFSNVQSEPSSTNVNWSDAGLVWDTVKTGHHLPGANLSYNLGSTTAWWGTLYGVSTQAKYADLAENYQADNDYQPGQVLMFGGDREVTLADADTTAVAGVVSTNPAHLMNGALSGANVVAIALQGRVPCNVIGPVKKGDLMVSAGFGYAKASKTPTVGQVIGKALSSFDGAKGQIEVVVGRV